jgi:hypothetical protein
MLGALLLTTSSCSSCWQHPVDTGGRWFTEATLQEAIKERENFINSYFKPCKNGDKEYRYAFFQPDRNTSTFVALKNIRWFWIGRKLSPADVENGIKFIGDIFLDYNNSSLVRQYSKDKVWSDASAMNNNFARSMKVTLKNGEWIYDSAYKSVPVSCDELVSGSASLDKYLTTQADIDSAEKKKQQEEFEKAEIEKIKAPINKFIDAQMPKCNGHYIAVVSSNNYPSDPPHEQLQYDAQDIKIQDLKYEDIKDKNELAIEVSLVNPKIYKLSPIIEKETTPSPSPTPTPRNDDEFDYGKNSNQNSSLNKNSNIPPSANTAKPSASNIANKPLLFIGLKPLAFFFGIGSDDDEDTEIKDGKFTVTVSKASDNTNTWKLKKSPTLTKFSCSDFSKYKKELVEN